MKYWKEIFLKMVSEGGGGVYKFQIKHSPFLVIPHFEGIEKKTLTVGKTCYEN